MTKQIYWIDGPWSGKLAIIARPRGDDWLEDELRALQRADVDVIVSLLTPSETRELGLTKERELVQGLGLQYISYPIVDRGIPGSVMAARAVIENIAHLLSQGENVGIHCRLGVGRSAFVAASLLARAGIPVDVAFRRIENARGSSVPDTAEQRQWVERFAISEMPIHR